MQNVAPRSFASKSEWFKVAVSGEKGSGRALQLKMRCSSQHVLTASAQFHTGIILLWLERLIFHQLGPWILTPFAQGLSQHLSVLLIFVSPSANCKDVGTHRIADVL